MMIANVVEVFFCTSKRVPPNRARDVMVNLIRSVAADLVAGGKWPGAAAL